MKRKHIVYFDYLRFIGAILVVYIHVASPLVSGDIPMNFPGRCFLIFLLTIAYTAVPMFFMMSGYLILTDSKTQMISTLKHRIVHLALPLLFWTVIVALWAMIRDHDFSLADFVGYVLSGFSAPIMQHFWYVYTLIALYILSPIIYSAVNGLKTEGKKYLIMLIILVFIQTMVTAIVPDNQKNEALIKPLSDLKLLGGHLLTFVSGYFLGNIKKRIPNIILVIIALADFIFISCMTVYITLDTGYSGVIQDQGGGFTVLLAACIFLLFKQNISEGKSKSRLTPFVKMSFGIYLMHNLLNRVLSYFGWEVTGVLIVFMKTAVIVILCYLVIKTLATIKPICFLASGVPYSTANESFNWRYTIRKLNSRSGIKGDNK